MRKLVLCALILSSQISWAQVWTEDFTAEAVGSTSGTATGTPGGTWSVATTPTGTFSVQNVALVGKSFFVDDTTTEGVWQSNAFTIPSPGFATISVDLATGGTNATDYIRCYYRVDGGPEVLFAEMMGQFLDGSTTGSAYVSGTTLQIVMRGQDNQFGTFFGIPLGFSMDNLEINLAPAVFSRKNGTWTDVTAGNSTWSAVALGGVSCNCTPSATQVAVIGGGNTVTLPAGTQTVGGVDVKNTGRLQYNTNAGSVTVMQGLFRVESGGIVNSSGAGITGEQIIFNANLPGSALQVDAGGTVSIEDFVLSAGATNLHYFTGGGSLTITDDVLIGADNSTLTAQMTSALTITDRIEFSAGTTGADFVNSQTLTANSATYDDDNNTFINAGTLTLQSIAAVANSDDNNIFTNTGTLALNGATSIDPQSADFFINNSGTINQAGNFANLVAACDFRNLTNGVWNWSLVTAALPANLNSVLICSATDNTFNYNAAGNQVMAGIVYHDLNNSISGTKTLSANATVNGDLSISGTAVTAPSTFNLTVTGTTSITGGSFNDASDTGSNIFVGNVSVAGGTSFISTAVTTTANLVFRGGIANAGTFTAGGATFNTNNQALTGASAISFANNVAINAITVTNSNTGAFTITGTTTLTSGGFTDNDNTSATTFVGNVSQTGTSAFNTTAVTTNPNLVFRGGITNNGGTFTAGAANFNTNNQTITGNAVISFANFVQVTGFTVTNTNTSGVSFTRSPADIVLTGAGSWSQGANGVLNYNGTSISITGFDATGTGNTVNYNSTTAAQTIRTPTTSYHHLTLSGTGNQTKTLSGNTIAAGNLSIQNTAIFSASTFNLSVGGNWANSSTNADPFIQGAQTVTFNGAAAQSITNTGDAQGSEFNSITVANTFGTRPQLTLSTPVQVSGALTLNQGVVATTATNLLTLIDNATTNGGDADSYVDGPIRKIGNDAFTFPTGDGAFWARVAISAPATATTEFTAQYFVAAWGDVSTDGTFNDPSDNEYWTLTRAVNTDAVTVRLFWEDNVRSQINSPTADLLVARHNGADWINHGQSAITSAGATGSVTSNLVSTFTPSPTPFTFGSIAAGATNPLPVELISFNAEVVDDAVQLTWETASELNNDYFNVQRSAGSEVFSAVGENVNGHGTTNQNHTYSLVDSNPILGTSYYRLKQTDFDGTISYSKIISIEFKGSPFDVYPNPSSGTVNIRMKGLTNIKIIPLVIYDQMGRECFQVTLPVDENSGTVNENLSLEGQLPKGVYTIKAGISRLFVRKLVIGDR